MADRNGALGGLPFTDDQHVRDLLHLGVPDLVPYLLVAPVDFQRSPRPSSFSRFVRYGVMPNRTTDGIVRTCTGASQVGKAPGKVFGQDADKAFDACP